jgi:putative nucleotidyltransferase with HDIG domain
MMGGMRQRIEELFADQLSRIGDEGLRDGVTGTWTAAAGRGGWTPDDLQRIPFTLLTDTHGINLIQHTIAVTEGAAGLARAITGACDPPFAIDMDLLLAGGLLHDVGKLLEYGKAVDGSIVKSHHGMCARHPVSGAIIAAEFGMPLEVVNMIACHAKEGEGRPQRVETVLIHQADYATFDPLVMLQKGLLIT